VDQSNAFDFKFFVNWLLAGKFRTFYFFGKVHNRTENDQKHSKPLLLSSDTRIVLSPTLRARIGITDIWALIVPKAFSAR
jgi:hypothetical protein